MNLSARMMAHADAAPVPVDERIERLAAIEKLLEEIKRLAAEEEQAHSLAQAKYDEAAGGALHRMMTRADNLQLRAEKIWEDYKKPLGERYADDAGQIAEALAGHRRGAELARDLYREHRLYGIRAGQYRRSAPIDGGAWTDRGQAAKDMRRAADHGFKSSYANRDDAGLTLARGLHTLDTGDEDLTSLQQGLDKRVHDLRRAIKLYERLAGDLSALLDQEGADASPQEAMIARLVTEVEALGPDDEKRFAHVPVPETDELAAAHQSIGRAYRAMLESPELDEFTTDVIAAKDTLRTSVAMLIHATNVKKQVEALLEQRIALNTVTAKTTGYYLTRLDSSIEHLAVAVDAQAEVLRHAVEQLDAALARCQDETSGRA